MSENVKVIEMVPETKTKKGFAWKVLGAVAAAVALVGGGVFAYNKCKSSNDDEDLFQEDEYPWGTGNEDDTEDVVVETEEE